MRNIKILLVEAITLAKIINFNEFKAKQAYKNSANVDLNNEWHDVVEDIDCMEKQYVGANSNSNRNTTFYKLCKSILISIKKCLPLKDLKTEH
jgi:hypothetical protein